MRYQTRSELQTIADINPHTAAPLMTRASRMERWIELLEQNPSRCLSALVGTEHLHPLVRVEARAAGSALSVAYEDPLLRASGLQSDTFGEAKRFFELSDWDLHEVVCSCHVGATMQAGWAAGRVRRILRGSPLLAWFRRLLIH